jgi:hypothetical protein
MPRKITVEVPEKLLEAAQRATRAGITETICAGLQLLIAGKHAAKTYKRLRQFRGKVKFSRAAVELKTDR